MLSIWEIKRTKQSLLSGLPVELVLPYLKAYWSILESRSRLKRKRHQTNKQNNSNHDNKTYGEVKYIFVVKKPQNIFQGLCVLLEAHSMYLKGNPGNRGPVLHVYLTYISLSCPSCSPKYVFIVFRHPGIYTCGLEKHIFPSTCLSLQLNMLGAANSKE